MELFNKTAGVISPSNRSKFYKGIPAIKLWTVLAGIMLVVSSCTKTTPAREGNTGEGNTPPPAGAGKTVTGFVRDTKGKPVAGASVRAENDIYNGWVEGTTDQNGKYTLSGIEWGGWKIYAWKDVQFDNKTYHLRMGMPATEDYNPFAGDNGKAVVKNFVWQLSGSIPDRTRDELNASGYFGGSINFVTLDINFNALPDGTEVTVTCTPLAGAALFDGNPAKTVVKKFTAFDTKPARWAYLVHDIPQSQYNISATCVINGQVKKILMGWKINETTHATIDNFSFQPAGSSHGSYESGIETQTDRPIYMRVDY